MTAKLTPWFDGSVKPVRPGVYERDGLRQLGSIVYSRWTGDRWLLSANSLDGAYLFICTSDYQTLKWRGLAEEPK